jgi:hypothetical protein
MADQNGEVTAPSHARGARHHRTRKQQKPSTAEREQKKASRLQALGPGESIKEKQVGITKSEVLNTVRQYFKVDVNFLLTFECLDGRGCFLYVVN